MNRKAIKGPYLAGKADGRIEGFWISGAVTVAVVLLVAWLAPGVLEWLARGG